MEQPQLALLTATNHPRWPYQRDVVHRAVSASRAQFDEPELAAAWAEGQALSVEQIIAEALQEAPTA